MWYARRLRDYTLYLSVVITMAYGGKVTATEYHPEIVFNPGGSGQIGGVSIALDSLDQPHLLFTDFLSRSLLYARQIAGQWQVETVSTAPLINGQNGLTIDSVGRPHIAVVNYETRDVMHAVLDSGTWNFETVAYSAGRYTPAVEVDAQNNPLVAYSSAINAGRPELASRTSPGVWSTMLSLVPNTLLYDSSDIDLEIDNGGVPHISYMGLSGYGQPSFISVVSPDPALGGILTASQVTSDFRNDFTYVTADLDISDDGEYRIVSTTTGALGRESHRVLTNGVWEEYILSSRGGVFTNPAALAIDSLGQSHILQTRIHQNSGTSLLNLFSIVPSGYEAELLESHSTGGGSAWLVGMKIDSNDGMHIVYTSELNRGISYLYIPEPVSFTLVAVGGLALLRRDFGLCRKPDRSTMRESNR